MVACGCNGSARIDQRDGSSGAGEHEWPDATVTLGEYERSYAAVALAGSQHQWSDAAFTLGEYQRTNAAFTLVVKGTVPH